MAEKNDNTATVLIAFVAGAALAAGITMLLTPKSGREVREKLGDVTDDAVQKLKRGAREARFKVAKKTPEDAFYYDGGDCWI